MAGSHTKNASLLLGKRTSHHKYGHPLWTEEEFYACVEVGSVCDISICRQLYHPKDQARMLVCSDHYFGCPRRVSKRIRGMNRLIGAMFAWAILPLHALIRTWRAHQIIDLSAQLGSINPMEYLSVQFVDPPILFRSSPIA